MAAYNPKSRFVKEKLARTKWKNRGYIDQLLVLEACALGKRPCGFADAMYVHGIKGRYEHEYLEILKELNPSGYKRHLKEKQKEEREAKRAEAEYRKQERIERTAAKKSWQKAGGK